MVSPCLRRVLSGADRFVERGLWKDTYSLFSTFWRVDPVSGAIYSRCTSRRTAAHHRLLFVVRMPSAGGTVVPCYPRLPRMCDRWSCRIRCDTSTLTNSNQFCRKTGSVLNINIRKPRACGKQAYPAVVARLHKAAGQQAVTTVTRHEV